MKYAIPVCPTCGATLPHDNPMSLQFHRQRLLVQTQIHIALEQEARLFDEAVARARALGRPFQVEEVFKVIWDTTGLELVPQMDARFVLVKEATGTQRRLWGLRHEEGTK